MTAFHVRLEGMKAMTMRPLPAYERRQASSAAGMSLDSPKGLWSADPARPSQGVLGLDRGGWNVRDKPRRRKPSQISRSATPIRNMLK